MWKHTCPFLILLALAALPCAHPSEAAMMAADAEEQIRHRAGQDDVDLSFEACSRPNPCQPHNPGEIQFDRTLPCCMGGRAPTIAKTFVLRYT